MTSGYDKRTRLSGPVQFRSVDPYLSSNYGGKMLTTSEQVISFRDDVQGVRLDPSAVDIYHGFFKSSGAVADYLNPGPRLLSQMEAAGLAEKSDYKSLDGFGFDNGHPFEHVKSSAKTSLRGLAYNWTPSGRGSGLPRVSGGPVWVGRTTVPISEELRMPFLFDNGRTFDSKRAIPALMSSDLESYGTRAMSLTAPAVPHVSLSASIGELLLGLPSVPGYSLLKSGALGSAGSEYLNMVFGILPTLDDATKFGKVLRNLSVALHQYRRDVGRRVRRSFVYPTIQKGEIFEGLTSSCYAGNSAQFLGFSKQTDYGTGSTSGGTLGDFSASTTLFMLESREIWFSGSFTYLLPEIPGFSGRLERYMSEYDRLLGLQMDSRAAWQLTPWSWLIDWFTDIRENLAAIQLAHDDNLVMNYGYAMEQSTRTAVAETKFPSSYTGLNSGRSSFVRTEMSTVSKRRLRANPYGFVSSADGSFWTPYRMAVLAALGISRT